MSTESPLDELNSLRLEVLEELPKAKQLVENVRSLHKVYMRFYAEGDKVILPEILMSELKFHIKHHFALLLYLVDELQFILDGKIRRNNKFKLITTREFIHPSRYNDFVIDSVGTAMDQTRPLYSKSIQGYFYEEQNVVKSNMVSTSLFVVNIGSSLIHFRLFVRMI
jgi:hypothetical protein